MFGPFCCAWTGASCSVGPNARAAASSRFVHETDVFSGSLQLRHAMWKGGYLPQPVEFPQGMISLSEDAVQLNSEFAYGSAKGRLHGDVTA